MNGNFTLFTSGGGGGGSASSDYVADSFLDTSVPAINNTGFSSTVSTNPNSQFFGNTDSPQYEAKTLWVKDLVLLSEKAWINRKPTYQVIFNEAFPSIFAYVVGNARLLNSVNGVSVSVRDIGDIFGVTGVVRKLAWLTNITTATGTGQIFVDGADTASTITYGSAATGTGQDGYNIYNAQVNSATNQTQNIHDFQIKANQIQTLSVAGIVVYMENATANIECFPGSTYLNKTKISTVVSSALAVPTVATQNGAITNIYKTISSTYATSTNAVPTIASIAVGASGGTSMDVTTGQGGSFLAGAGIVAISSGSSYYVGKITSVSTDTLTVSPALIFGVSGPIYKAWDAGPTYAINASIYSKAFNFDPGIASVGADINGFNAGASITDFYYSDPYKRFRAWGDALTFTSQDGNLGVGFNGASLGFLQFTGDFSAAEVLLATAPGATPAIANFSVAVNGTPTAYTVNEGYTGLNCKTLFTNAGPGINSVVISPGASINNCIISGVNFYKLNPGYGVSYGMLAYYETHANKANRTAYNASMMQLGMHMRTYADELYLKGAWTRGTTHSAAGGVYYLGATTTCQVSYGYYGTDFAVIGANASVLISLDGATTGLTQSFNTRQGVATLGFHSVVVSNLGPSTIINAIDHYRPRGEIVNVQNYLSTPQQDDAITVYQQSNTPEAPKTGDIWAQFPATNNNSAVQTSIWMYLFNKWNKLTISATVDDPNASMFFRFGGSSSGSLSASQSVAVGFNGAWSTLPSMPGVLDQGSSCDGSYKGSAYVVDGEINTTITQVTYMFNKLYWATGVNSANKSAQTAYGSFNNFFYKNKGIDDGSTAQSYCNKFNGIAFSNSTSWTTSDFRSGGFVVNNLISTVGGVVAGTAHEQKNSADANSSATGTVTGQYQNGANTSLTTAMVVYDGNSSNFTNNSYEWNGAAWTTVATVPTTMAGQVSGGMAYSQSFGGLIMNGGQTAASSGALAVTQKYNRIAWGVLQSSPSTAGAAYGSNL